MTLLSGTRRRSPTAVWRLLLGVGVPRRGARRALGAIGLFVSTLTEQPIGATIAVVLVNVMMFILDAIPQLAWLHPWLLTHWWTAFGDLLRDPIATDDLQRGLLTAGGVRRGLLAAGLGAVHHQGRHQLSQGAVAPTPSVGVFFTRELSDLDRFCRLGEQGHTAPVSPALPHLPPREAP